MLEKGKISHRQLTVLTLLYTIGTSILIVPSIIAVFSRQDGWIACLIGIAANLLSVWTYSALAGRYPTLTLAEFSEKILGKWLGKAISLFFLSFIFLLSSFLLRVVGNFMTTHIMPNTPIEIIIIIFMVVVVYAVRLGIETTARAAEIFLPFVIALFLFLTFFLLPQIELDRAEPVFENGIKPIILGAFYYFNLQEQVILMMLIPYSNRPEKARSALIAGTLLGSVVIIVSVLLSTLVLGTEFTQRNMYASYTLAKQISVGNFLQRVEAMLAIIWLITIFFKTVICVYAVTLGTAQTLKLKEYRTLTLPFALLLVFLSLLVYDNIISFIAFTPKVFSVYATIFMVLIPVGLLGIDAFRSSFKENQSSS
ncbi:GerAB/ArcD/ProY family transporter [Paenibacillus sp. JDR-2]|uniref:GerAB/ArcD/ProY family transporter n=1 Tax=Paenibacillus sp. (strain JDR-2) TaxID=324057 RepID=UPI00016665FE|nr:endospore germination permease [Paenibacillus sp. JDR-2]ACS99780.1 spore germination protein [Paenibacillus sp. JDR-2]